jgi:hypothetical protein
MNDLDRALSDIHTIRRQVARSTEFRGYGPATLAGTATLAVVAACGQMRWVHSPADHVAAYLGIWIATAILSASLIGAEMYARTRRIHTGMADEMIRMAVEQFLPAAGVGGLLTITLVKFVPGSAWMLPGLWQVIYALGILSSCRFLPRPMILAGAWYLLTGLTAIALGDGRALSPQAMGVPFAVGQMLIAGVLLLTHREASDRI